jgi:hypothetical protein
MAPPKKNPDDLKNQRIPIMMSEDELQAIDDWRFANRLPSRGDAIRRLCQIGILSEGSIDHISDQAVETLNFVTDEFGAAYAEFRAVIRDETADVLFTQDQMRDALDAGIHRQIEALDRVQTLSELVITLYNAILPFTEAETLKRGAEASEAVINKANESFARVADRRLETEENRYIAINLTAQTKEVRDEYENLSEDDKEQFLTAAIERLRTEEEADPEAFRQKYGRKPFWEVEGWIERAKSRRRQD